MEQSPSEVLTSSSDIKISGVNNVVRLDNQKSLSRLFYRTIQEITVHTLVMAASLASIWGIHFLLIHLVGPDKKFFNIIPISWIIDTGDILIIGKFLWEVARGFLRREELTDEGI